MSAAIETDKELTEEAFDILRRHLPPHKVARLLALWRVGSGDYVKEREALLSGTTVDSLYEEAASAPN